MRLAIRIPTDDDSGAAIGRVDGRPEYVALVERVRCQPLHQCSIKQARLLLIGIARKIVRRFSWQSQGRSDGVTRSTDAVLDLEVDEGRMSGIRHILPNRRC